MAITGRIVRVPDPMQKIPMIKLARECIQRTDLATGVMTNIGLKEAKELVDQACAGGHEYTFPNKESLNRLMTAGFVVENVVGIASLNDEQTLTTIKALLQDAMDSEDIEAFEALEVAYKMYMKRVRGI